MIQKIESAISKLAEEAEKATDADMAATYTLAVLNLAKARETLAPGAHHRR